MYSLGMQDVPATGVMCPDRLRASLAARVHEWALFVDIDGTLLDMAPAPDAVEVPRGLVDTLARLKLRFGGAIALITGRRIADADRFFAPLKLAALGVHGTEARTEPRGRTAMLGEVAPRDLARAVHDIAGTLPGVLVEDKGAGLAVHYRHAPDARPALELELRRLVTRWERFGVRPGRRVLEVLPRTHSKGTGLARLMELPVFRGRRPVVIGDDHGDEPALRVAERLGGIGLRVAGEHFRKDDAEFDNPASVRAWLAGVLAVQEAARGAPTQSSGRHPSQ
jgi:trehalose 6-phosphate phosphatase